MSTELSSLIYVVDDDPAIRHSTRFFLEGEGHAVEAFASGLDFLAAYPGATPDCVLLDQVMPGLDGLEVVRRLRALDPLVPVILITGHPDLDIRTRARVAGVPLIEKPFVSEALLSMLAATTSLRGRTAHPAG